MSPSGSGGSKPENVPAIQDPRDRREELLETRTVERVGPDRFEELTATEAFRMGWVVGAVVIDSQDRLLLAYHGGDQQWVLPGGTVKPGESLPEAVEREVCEETGVIVEPERPIMTDESEIRCDGRRDSVVFVVFEATPTTTAIGSDLGEAGEPIERAAWFETLPQEVYKREQTKNALHEVGWL